MNFFDRLKKARQKFKKKKMTLQMSSIYFTLDKIEGMPDRGRNQPQPESQPFSSFSHHGNHFPKSSSPILLWYGRESVRMGRNGEEGG